MFYTIQYLLDYEWWLRPRFWKSKVWRCNEMVWKNRFYWFLLKWWCVFCFLRERFQSIGWCVVCRSLKVYYLLTLCRTHNIEIDATRHEYYICHFNLIYILQCHHKNTTTASTGEFPLITTTSSLTQNERSPCLWNRESWQLVNYMNRDERFLIATSLLSHIEIPYI